MLELDALLDQAVAEAEIAEGVPLATVAVRSPGVMVEPVIEARTKVKGPMWCKAEDEFILQHQGYYDDYDLAAVLGRSADAIKIRRQRHLNLPGPSANPEFITAHRMAQALGVDGHTIVKLVDRDLLPAWLFSVREMRLTRYVTFLRWAVNPLHWVYFWRSVEDTERIADLHLRRLIERQKARWKDAWWSIGQVAEYHGVGHTDVNRYVRAGKINGVQWGNWWFLRSEAMRSGLYFLRGKGQNGLDWSEEADAFLIIGTALGVRPGILAAMMKQPVKRVRYRVKYMGERGIDREVIDKFGLRVAIDEAGDWVAGRDEYGWMFPRVNLLGE